MDQLDNPDRRAVEHELAQAIQGDEDAVSSLCTRYRPRIEAYVATKLGRAVRRWVTPEDIAQAVLAKTLRAEHLAQLSERSEDELLKHLQRTASTMSIDAARKFRRQRGSSVSPEQRLEGRVERTSCVTREDSERWYRELIERLPESHGSVLEMRIFQEMSFVEIGERLGISPDAARKRFEQATGALRTRLDQRRHGH